MHNCSKSFNKEQGSLRIKNFDIIIKNRLGPYYLTIKKDDLYQSHDKGISTTKESAYGFQFNPNILYRLYEGFYNSNYCNR